MPVSAKTPQTAAEHAGGSVGIPAVARHASGCAPTEPLALYLLRAQLRLFCQGYGWQLLANLLVAAASLALFARALPLWWQGLWWVAMALNALARFVPQPLLVPRNPPSLAARRRRLVIGDLVDGLLWATLIVAVPRPLGSVNPPFLVAIVVGLVAGPIPFLSVLPAAFAAFTVPPAVALAWREFTTDRSMGLAMGVSILGLQGIALMISQLSHTASRQRILRDYRLQHMLRRSRRREATVRTLIEASPDLIALVSADGRWQFANSVTTTAIGLNHARLINANRTDLLADMDDAEQRENLRQLMGSGSAPVPPREELLLRTGQQAPRVLDLLRCPLPTAVGGGFILLGRDITVQRRDQLGRQLRDRLAQASLRGEALEGALGTTLNAIADHLDLLWLAVLRTTPDGRPLAIAQGGRLRLDSATATALALAPPDPPHRVVCPLIYETTSYGLIVYRPLAPTMLADDARSWLEQLADDIGTACQLDVAQDRLRTLAHYDELTGLPNRTLFLQLLRDLVRDAPDAEQLHALLFLDLDRFKQINDSLGHAAGDRLLREVTARIRDVIRNGDIVARLSGDEYAILLRHVQDVTAIEHILARLLTALRVPVRINADLVSTQASIGVTLIPLDDADAHGLLQHADLAMYEAKRGGRDRWCLFEPALDTASRDRHALQTRLRQALAENQFTLHYQPQVELRTRRVVGVEALLRWSDSAMGPQAPDVFVPIAEESGLIVPLGEWVLREACAQQRRWVSEGMTLLVAVNLSPGQFLDPDLHQRVEEALAAGGTDAQHIALEITERSAFADPTRARAILSAWREQGLQCAIDDFGTGQASLSYLTDLPAELIKIDRAFIAPLPDDLQHCAIVEGVIRMAHQLGRRVLAEGTETEAQLTWLTAQGCDLAQGYAISRPLCAADLQPWLQAWQRAQTPLPALVRPGDQVNGAVASLKD